MTCSLTCQHLCHQVSRCLPRLFLTKQDQHYSPTEDTDLQWKFNHPPPSKAVKVIQVGHKWQSNHYKVRVEKGGRKSRFLFRQTGSLALSEGVPARGLHFGSLISVRVSEAVKCGGKPKPWGRAQMVERSQDCKRSSTLKGVRWLFHLR